MEELYLGAVMNTATSTKDKVQGVKRSSGATLV